LLDGQAGQQLVLEILFGLRLREVDGGKAHGDRGQDWQELWATLPQLGEVRGDNAQLIEAVVRIEHLLPQELAVCLLRV
jgi:hypothetical protein